MSDTKLCPRCNETKPIEQFGRNRACRDGRCVYCKSCKKKLNRAVYDKRHEPKPRRQKRTDVYDVDYHMRTLRLTGRDY